MTIDVSMLTEYASYLVLIIGAMAGIVSAITQVIKELPGLNTFPTKALVIILSIILCPTAFVMYCSWKAIQVKAYMLFAVIIGSFFVALVAMDGWDKVYDIMESVKAPKDKN